MPRNPLTPAMIGSRSPTTREIAAACGCSQSTVSNALRDDPRISPPRRAQIQAAARRLGWRANPLASAFMAHLRATRRPAYRASVAFLVTHPHSGKIEDLPPNQQENFQGARLRAEALGYALEPVWIQEPGMTAARLARILQTRGVPGFLLPGLLAPTDLFAAFPWDAFASVALGHVLPGASLHRAAFHYAGSVPLALRRLFDLGYRRIGVIVSTTYDTKVNHGWLYPLYYEQRQPWGRRWIKSCVFSGAEPDDHRRVRAWIERERPDVILGEYLAWHVLGEMGWRIPADVAFATFDWSADHADIGGIHQSHATIGHMAMDLLTTQLVQNERGLSLAPKRLLIEGGWRDGPSIPVREPSADRQSILCES